MAKALVLIGGPLEAFSASDLERAYTSAKDVLKEREQKLEGHKANCEGYCFTCGSLLKGVSLARAVLQNYKHRIRKAKG